MILKLVFNNGNKESSLPMGIVYTTIRPREKWPELDTKNPNGVQEETKFASTLPLPLDSGQAKTAHLEKRIEGGGHGPTLDEELPVQKQHPESPRTEMIANVTYRGPCYRWQNNCGQFQCAAQYVIDQGNTKPLPWGP